MYKQREEFEAWLDRVTRHPDSTMPTPWQTWQAAKAAQPSQAGLSVDEILDIASKSIPADHPAEQVDILECAHALFAAINTKKKL